MTFKEAHIEIGKDKELVYSLKELYTKKYSDDYHSMSDKKFLEWLLATYDFYEYQHLVPNEDKELESQGIIMNGKDYQELTIYCDGDSNIKMWQLNIGKLRKDYINKADCINDFNLLKNGVPKNLRSTIKGLYDYVKNLKNQTKETKRFLTDDDWYGNYEENSKKYCKGYLRSIPSNLDIWRITLSGNDDYSISTDYLSKEECYKQWNILCNNKIVNKDDLKDHYFSN